MELEKIAPEKVDLIKSLRELDISDEEIAKSLDILTEEDKVEKKSIEEQIVEKQAELDGLQKFQKPDKDELDIVLDEKFDGISKSISNQIGESNSKFEDKFDGLVGLVKSLTDKIIVLSEDNKQLIKDNDDLKKSFSGSEEVLRKLAEFTPGLRSLSNANYIERFEKSATDDGKEILSISKHKGEISSRLSAKMDEPEFAKNLGNDIANFECSGRISPKLEKAFADELGFEVVA